MTETLGPIRCWSNLLVSFAKVQIWRILMLRASLVFFRLAAARKVEAYLQYSELQAFLWRTKSICIIRSLKLKKVIRMLYPFNPSKAESYGTAGLRRQVSRQVPRTKIGMQT
jgi:hypothetical protein